MAFKSKIDPNEISSMTFKEYFGLLKKEIKKAEKFGNTNIVVLSDFHFACGHIGTMMVLGKHSGIISKWYKKIKKERKKENDFARGNCYFKIADDGDTTLHIALEDGKGKPDKMKKNGKNLFKKLGFSPNIFKGEFLEDVEGVLSEQELATMDEEADKMNDDKKLGFLSKKYRKAFEKISNEVIPALKNKESINLYCLEVAKDAYVAGQSFIDRFDEVSQKEQDRYEVMREKIVANMSDLEKVVAKVKQLLMASADINIDIESVIEDLADKKSIIDNQINQLDPMLKSYLELN